MNICPQPVQAYSSFGLSRDSSDDEFAKSWIKTLIRFVIKEIDKIYNDKTRPVVLTLAY